MLPGIADSEIKTFLERCTVPLMVDGDRHGLVRGTGSLLNLGGASYFITAAHVVKGLDFNTVGLPVASAPGSIRVVNVQHGRVVQTERWRVWTFRNARVCFLDRPELDVAVIALDSPEVIEGLMRTWAFLSVDNILSPVRATASYLIAGYPNAPVDLRGEPIFNLNVFLTQRIAPPDGIDWKETPDPDIDMFLEYDVAGKDEWGRQAGTPDLHGVSGAIVWAVVRDGPRSPIVVPFPTVSSCIKVAGIQSSFSHRSFIRAKKLAVLPQVFRRLNPLAADELESAIRGG